MDIKTVLGRIFLSQIVLGDVTVPFSLLKFILAFVLPLIVLSVLFKLLKKGTSLLLAKGSLTEESRHRVFNWTRRIINIIFLAVFVILFSNLFGAETIKYFSIFFGVINQPLIESGGTRITIITIILTIPVFYLASWTGKTVKRLANREFLGRLGLDESRKFSFTSIIQYAVMFIVVLFGLSIIGIDLSALALIFGVLGIGLGFGLQTTIANLIAGLQIIFARPVKEGDQILVNGLEGIVSQIRLNSTIITTLTNESIIIPNSKLVENDVHNYSYEDRSIVTVNKVQISYDDDPEKASKILDEIGRENPFREKSKPPKVRHKGFGDSGMDMSLFILIRDVSLKYDSEDWTNRQIWKRFRENGISIPFPHVQLKYEKENGPGSILPPEV